MKKILQAIRRTSCQNRRRNKQTLTKDSCVLNKDMGACLGSLQPREPPIKIILVPCESQPPSSSRIWTVNVKRKLPWFGTTRCKIVQNTGNRVSEPFHGQVLAREDQIVIKGILTDGAVEGKYFELVLCTFSDQTNGSPRSCSAKNTLSGFLQRSLRDKNDVYEITHDAFLHTSAESHEVLQTKLKHELARKKLTKESTL